MFEWSCCDTGLPASVPLTAGFIAKKLALMKQGKERKWPTSEELCCIFKKLGRQAGGVPSPYSRILYTKEMKKKEAPEERWI